MQKSKSNKVKKSNNLNVLKIAAGEMPIVSGKVKPNSDKGEIRIFIRDELLQFEWTNLDKNISTDPIVIFQAEWDWVKVQTQKGRVYKLQNKCFPEEQFFYWMQGQNKSEDEINEVKIKNILESGKLEEELYEEIDDGNFGVESIIRKEEQPSNAPGTNNNVDFIKNLANTLSIGKSKHSINILEKYPNLNKILTTHNIYKILDDDNVCQELFKLLPENQQNKAGLIENISSPQFQQALESLSSVKFIFKLGLEFRKYALYFTIIWS